MSVDIVGNVEARSELEIGEIEGVLSGWIQEAQALTSTEQLSELKSKINEFLKDREIKLGVLSLISIVVYLIKGLEKEDSINEKIKEALINHLKSWVVYGLAYFNVDAPYQGGWTDGVYKSIIQLRKGGAPIEISYKDPIKRFYYFWHLALYQPLKKEEMAQYLPMQLDKEVREDGKICSRVGDKEILIKPERYLFVMIVLEFQEFMRGAKGLNIDFNNIGDIQQLKERHLKGDFYLAFRLVELWNLYMRGMDILPSLNQIEKDPKELLRLETHINLLPFWGLKIRLLKTNKDVLNSKQEISQLYYKIAATLVSYFGREGINKGNWHIQILSRILGVDSQKLVEQLKYHYDNFITDFVEKSRKAKKRITPPGVIGRLEKVLGPMGVIVWYPGQSNIESFGQASYYKNFFEEKDLRDLMAKVGVDKREWVNEIGQYLMPWGSYARLVPFGTDPQDIALIIVIREGKTYPPFNEEILNIIAKAINKDGFNLEAMLDFFVLNEAKETQKHLNSVASIYSAVLRLFTSIDPTLGQEEGLGGLSSLIKKATIILAKIFGKQYIESERPVEALYHDIGKIGPPRAYINLKRRLNREEKEIVETHTILGAGFLWRLGEGAKGRSAQKLREAAIIALLHHSLSRGYPFSINMNKKEFENKKQERLELLEGFHRKSQIKYFEYAIQFLQDLSYETLQGRWKDYAKQILAIHIADIYDALRENRPYRDAMEPEQAVEELKKELKALDDSDHPFNGLWEEIKPQLTPNFLEKSRQQALGNLLGD